MCIFEWEPRVEKKFKFYHVSRHIAWILILNASAWFSIHSIHMRSSSVSCAYDKDEKLSSSFFVYFHVFDFYRIELVFGDIVCKCVRIDASSSASIYQLPICFGGIQFGCYPCVFIVAVYSQLNVTVFFFNIQQQLAAICWKNPVVFGRRLFYRVCSLIASVTSPTEQKSIKVMR